MGSSGNDFPAVRLIEIHQQELQILISIPYTFRRNDFFFALFAEKLFSLKISVTLFAESELLPKISKFVKYSAV